MKTKIWISFNAWPVPGGASTILEAARCGKDVANVIDAPILNQIFVDVQLDEHDERISNLLVLLDRYSIERTVHPFIEYSEDDRQNARLLWMSPPDINDSVYAGCHQGTKYDLTNACANCYAGARQTSELFVEGDEVRKIRKHRAISSFEHAILVDGGMAKKLKDAGVTGFSLGDVRARLRNEKWSTVARDQILIEHTMPPMRSELTEDDKKHLCPVCRRGGRITLPLKPYRAEDLQGMQDFNLTWEWFGAFWPENKEKGRSAKWPHPYVLVTPKVMNIFRDAGVKTFEWRPVLVEG